MNIVAYRYRIGLFGRLILQVGRRVLYFPGNPGIEWRDARVTDITVTKDHPVIGPNEE